MPSSGGKTCADRKSTRLNSSHTIISYAVFCLKKKQDERATHAHTQHRPAPPAPRQTTHAPAGSRREGRCGHCRPPRLSVCASLFFFFNDTATTEIYTLSLHDALPI